MTQELRWLKDPVSGSMVLQTHPEQSRYIVGSKQESTWSEWKVIPIVMRDKMNDSIENLKEKIKFLENKLPEEMKGCKIIFKSCSLGHGWLTATNWIDFPCPTCERKRIFEATKQAAMDCCSAELKNTGLLMSNPPLSAAAWDARNQITKISYDRIKTQKDDIVVSAEEFIRNVLRKWGQETPDDLIEGAAIKLADSLKVYKK